MRVDLKKVDQSGVYALPEGSNAEDLQMVLLNGIIAEYVSIKDGTEIDIPLARTGSIVTAIFKEG